MRSHRVSWGHWRSQVVMMMTSFPNYYVINDFIVRTSFLGQMDWNSVQNDIFGKIIKPIVILSQNPWLLTSLPVPKSLPVSTKFSKWRLPVFWPRVTSNDLGWPWMTFYWNKAFNCFTLSTITTMFVAKSYILVFDLNGRILRNRHMMRSNW